MRNHPTALFLQTGPRTLFTIEACGGFDVQPFSAFPSEEEILLLPASYFEVMGVASPAPGLSVIHVKQWLGPNVLS